MLHFSTSFRAILARVGMCMALGLLGGSALAQNAPTWASVQRGTAANTNSGSEGYSIAVSADGSQYVTGEFKGIVTFGNSTLTAGAGEKHLFLVKYSAAGAVLWAQKIDAGSNVNSRVAVDAAGNAYLTGYFDSTITLGTTTLTTTGRDAYLVKYDAQGTSQWVRRGGTTGTSAGSIATDAGGNVLITGDYETSVAFGGTPLTGGGVFFYQISPTGAVLVATRIANRGSSRGLTTDNSGNAYVVGSFTEPTTFGTTTLTSAGDSDIFLCKLNALGAVIWARRDGGTGRDGGSGVAVDANGNPVVGGYTGNSVYVARYSTQGAPLWTRQIASDVSYGNTAEGVAYDGRGGYYITGFSRGAIVFGATTLTSIRTTAFVVRYDSQGTVQWAGQAVGPTGDDIAYGNGIAADGSGNVYITGFFRGAITFGSLPAITSSNLAAFQAKLNAGGVITATTQRAAALILAVHPNPASDGATVSGTRCGWRRAGTG